MRYYTADYLWDVGRWVGAARFAVDSDGCLTACKLSMPVKRAGRWVLPGMPNLHSHAFQRAMAGLAERHGPCDDSFWTWREMMYRFAARITPDDLRAVAAQLYVEMLRAGYTHVCEFHYLHNAPDGKPYADPAAMSLAIVAAAREAGIGLTLLPVLYMTGGFDGRALVQCQQRFGLTLDAYLRLMEALTARESTSLRVGVALHSLRAVPEAALCEVLASPLVRGRVVHIHIAEQTGEVQDCMDVRGARPVHWLFDHAEVDARWCLVHATQIEDSELRLLAQSRAVVGLCPTTEANLGDGLFPLVAYLKSDGMLGIGSDSHISVSPVEELRWLEYGQRLVRRHRSIAAYEPGASVAEVLWSAALRGGRQASGLPEAGGPADFIVLDDAAPTLAARGDRDVLDSFVFSGNVPLVRDVMAGGAWVIHDYHHHAEDEIASRYRETLQRLRASV